MFLFLFFVLFGARCVRGYFGRPGSLHGTAGMAWHGKGQGKVHICMMMGWVYSFSFGSFGRKGQGPGGKRAYMKLIPGKGKGGGGL